MFLSFWLSMGVALPAMADDAQGALDFPIERYELDNGLRVVLLPDHRSPTVGVAVYYDVGSRNERPGRSGFAHLFEHMMFEGSEHIAKGEHFRHISGNGGRRNGTTSEDRTNYYETLPADRLALGLWLESDRMRSLEISLENFENQREVVKEERRMRVDNQPYVPAILEFMEIFYESWEYGHSVIGSMEDLDGAELVDVQAFFDLYYAPNNAVLAIAGDFDGARARQLVEHYFGDIPRGDTPPPVSFEEPPQTAVREAERTDPLASQPMLLLGWHVPPAPHPDHDAIELLNVILTSGESARLYERLIRSDEIALSVDGGTDRKRGPDQFYMSVITRGQPPEAARAAIMEEIAQLVDAGVSPEELASARQRMVRDLVFSVESNLRLALRIARDTLYFDEPDRINTEIDRLGRVTVADLQRVAETYLVESNMTVMIIRTQEEEAP